MKEILFAAAAGWIILALVYSNQYFEWAEIKDECEANLPRGVECTWQPPTTEEE